MTMLANRKLYEASLWDRAAAVEPRQGNGVQVALPWPPKELWPNFRSRTHWAKTRATKKAREDAFWTAKAAKLAVAAGDVPVIVAATFFPPDRRQRDYDNCDASLKAYRDGLADALGINDRDFRPVPPVFGPVHPGGCVVLRLETAA